MRNFENQNSYYSVAQKAEQDNQDQNKGSLVSKNITILGQRTSIRLEPEMWKALSDITRREGCSIHELTSLVWIRKKPETSLTSAIRVFLLLYYRAASTEAGHLQAQHGNFEAMRKRASNN